MFQLVSTKSFLAVLLLITCRSSHAFSGQIIVKDTSIKSTSTLSRREAFIRSIASCFTFGTIVSSSASPAIAEAPKMYTLDSGIKYAITKPATSSTAPLKGDIVAIDYTGYLTSGQIFDATHSEGKSNTLLFKVGTGSVIPGLDNMVANMKVGEKVQAIIPPTLAYDEKGVCLDSGECLIKPGSTLVYDIYLKKSTIPPP